MFDVLDISFIEDMIPYWSSFFACCIGGDRVVYVGGIDVYTHSAPVEVYSNKIFLLLLITERFGAYPT
jgi:hypothetical protein